MSTDFNFTPPGTEQATWDSFPARSECCQLEIGYQKQRVLVQGTARTLTYTTATPEASAVAIMALYAATDPSSLATDDVYVVDYDVGTAMAYIRAWGSGGETGSGPHSALSNTTVSGTDTTVEKSKFAYKVGWEADSPYPAWRAIDGGTVRVEYEFLRYIAGGGYDSTFGATHADLSPAVADTEAYQPSWTVVNETAGYEDFLSATLAYAPRTCVGG